MRATVPEKKVAHRIRAFVDTCREHGLRVTHQRTEIFREVASTAEHPDALTIVERVRSRIPSVSADTVYRTLATLESFGLIHKVQSWSSNTRYDANIDPHHHYVCGRCGLVRDFTDERFDTLSPPEEVAAWGDVRNVQVHLQGICSRCMAELHTDSERSKSC